jgi:hypothetical protein
VEPSRTRHCTQIDGDGHLADLHLGASWTLGPPPLFQSRASIPHATRRNPAGSAAPTSTEGHGNQRDRQRQSRVTFHRILPYHAAKKIWVGGTGDPSRSDLGFVQHHPPYLRLCRRSWRRQRRSPPPPRRMVTALVADRRLATPAVPAVDSVFLHRKTPLAARGAATAAVRADGGEGSRRRLGVLLAAKGCPWRLPGERHMGFFRS